MARASDGPPAAAPRPLDEELEAPSPALRLRDFVPVELVRHEAAVAAAAATSASRRRGARRESGRPDEAGGALVPTLDPGPAPDPAWDERVTLFADAEL